MLLLCLQSLARYLKWWLRALKPEPNPSAPLNWRRIFFLLLSPFLLAVQLLHWLGLFLDELLFPNYRKIKVEAPVFITGIPRSGTTFVHRTLAHDAIQFTTVSTWEAVLAPSITARKIIQLAQALDAKLGSPFAKIIHALTARAAGDFNQIHVVAPDAPEEDYLWLLPAASSLILLLAFPDSRYLVQTAALDTLPFRQRARLLDFYEACIRRHLYASGKGRRFLSKNAAFASWCPALQQRFPDAKFLLCMREPSEALRSQLSSLAPARRLFGTDPSGQVTARLFEAIFKHNYKALLRFIKNTQPGEVALVDQADLRKAPKPLLCAALQELGIQPNDPLRTQLEHLKAHHQTQHRYQASARSEKISEVGFYLKPCYHTLLNSPFRVQAAHSNDDT